MSSPGYQLDGGYKNVLATNTAYTITSAATTIAGVQGTIKTTICNNTAGTLCIVKQSTTGAATDGITLTSVVYRMEDTVWAGPMYLFSATTVALNVRFERIYITSAST